MLKSPPWRTKIADVEYDIFIFEMVTDLFSWWEVEEQIGFDEGLGCRMEERDVLVSEPGKVAL